VYLLIVVINDEDILEDLITGWLDIGITGATVMESTDLLQLISHHIPIFAGFRSFAGTGIRHNKTLLICIEKKQILDNAIEFLESVCKKNNKPSLGVYFVAPLLKFGRLGIEMSASELHNHLEKKIGRT
jgi:nitrogen regulatory protein P-II 1